MESQKPCKKEQTSDLGKALEASSNGINDYIISKENGSQILRKDEKSEPQHLERCGMG
ncbi:MAG: hypothetical protein M1544_03815 [Candidatus Marsarchaeota archaeon]|nr:hypothetical protein [Candidatus Marsarchaeota archaeon]